MPGGDGTGPLGQGSMTGRAAGYCAGFGVPGFANPGPRAGMGFRRGFRYFGRGRGFGRGMWFGRGYWGWPGTYVPVMYQTQPVEQYGQATVDNEKQILEEQAANLENQLKQIKDRIDQLKQ